MKNITQQCIDIFMMLFTEYPSIIEVGFDTTKESIDKFISKSKTIWVEEFFDGEGKKTIRENFVLYDKTGVMVYVKEETKVFILTTIDRREIAEFSLQTLKRLNQEKNGNNTRSITGEN